MKPPQVIKWTDQPAMLRKELKSSGVYFDMLRFFMHSNCTSAIKWYNRYGTGRILSYGIKHVDPVSTYQKEMIQLEQRDLMYR